MNNKQELPWDNPRFRNWVAVARACHVLERTLAVKLAPLDLKPARSVTVIDIDSVYFQCARAIVRSDLWNPARHVDQKSLPTPGQILEITSRKSIDGDAYDKEWPERAKKTMW